MERIRQRKSGDCGVCCLAMLTGKDYAEAWQACAPFLDCAEGNISFEKLPDLFDRLNIAVSSNDRLETEAVLPSLGCLCEIYYFRKDRKCWHYIVWDAQNKVFIDPQNKPARHFHLSRVLVLAQKSASSTLH